MVSSKKVFLSEVQEEDFISAEARTAPGDILVQRAELVPQALVAFEVQQLRDLPLVRVVVANTLGDDSSATRRQQ